MNENPALEISDEIKSEISKIGAKYTYAVNTPQGAWLYLGDIEPEEVFKQGISDTAAYGGFRIENGTVIMPFVPNPQYQAGSSVKREGM